jgi:tetratricopeptide (TPR) repeat protein
VLLQMGTVRLTLPEALKRAIAAHNDGKYSEAEGLCHAIIVAKHDVFEALDLLAVIQTKLRRSSEALASYGRALAIRPDSAEALNNRGNILWELKRFDEAVASYDRALSVRPNFAEALNNRGNTLGELKRFDEALASYEQALRVRPNDVTVLCNRAGVLQKLKRFEEALVGYERALAIRPDNAEAHYKCGNTLRELKRLEEALASYENAITLKPDYADALYNRGNTLWKLKRFAEAVASYKKAIAIKPDYGPLYLPLVVPNLGDTSQITSGTALTIKNVEQVPKVYWCLGMHGSASTWAYNVVRQIAASAYPATRFKEHFVRTLADVAGLDQPGHTHIVKTHQIEDEDAVAALSKRAEAIIITIRDPRDAVTSLMLYMHEGFDRSLSLIEKSSRLCARFAGEKRSLLLCYEAGFTNDAATLDRIAGTIHHSLAATDRMRIFASSRRGAVETLIAELPHQRTSLIEISSDDLMDPVTQWHTHHAGRTGEIGRWRHMLTEAQVFEVERRLGDWMDRFFYQRNKTSPA